MFLENLRNFKYILTLIFYLNPSLFLVIFNVRLYLHVGSNFTRVKIFVNYCESTRNYPTKLLSLTSSGLSMTDSSHSKI